VTRFPRLLALALPALLAACGDLPQPFAGHPGKLAEQLLQPPPARLAVPVPTSALLTDAAARAYDKALVGALQDQEVPAEAGAAHEGDWRLTVTAELRGNQVVPTFSVQDPTGADQGSTEAPPVDAELWADGSTPALRQSAVGSAPLIATLLTRIDAVRRQSDPNSLLYRPARVMVPDVTGAPGDGNYQLARQLRLQLPQLGEMVQDKPAGADFVVQGVVKLAPGPAGQQRVEIRWIVKDAQGRDLGQVVQLNDVPAGSLDLYWSDVAIAVAQQAATGVKQVIANALGGKAPEQPAARPAAATP